MSRLARSSPRPLLALILAAGGCGDGTAALPDLGGCSSGCAVACEPVAGCGWADLDGDGFSDVWEERGYIDVDCDGTNDPAVDTPLPGADPARPNVWVKWDYMADGAHSHRPTEAAMALVALAFARHGAILTFYPQSDALDEHSVVSLSPPGQLPACAGPDAISFYTLKAAHFPSRLAPAWRYAVFAHHNTCGSAPLCATCPATSKTGEAPRFGQSGLAELPGNDFIVSLGNDRLGDTATAGIFMHELGHTLGLGHGGGDSVNYKPGYMSVMNYSYELGIGRSPAPGPYPTSGASPAVEFHIDYSSFSAGTLAEGKRAGDACIDDGAGGLRERDGVTGGPADAREVVVFFAAGDRILHAPANGAPIDWDGNGLIDDAPVFADVNGDRACGALLGFDDWASTAPSPGVLRLTNLVTGLSCNRGDYGDGTPLVSSIADGEESVSTLLGRAPHLR